MSANYLWTAYTSSNCIASPCSDQATAESPWKVGSYKSPGYFLPPQLLMTIQDTDSCVLSKCGSLALQMGPHKKHRLSQMLDCNVHRLISLSHNSLSDPLLSHGHHFGRTVFTLCNYPSLLTNGILRLEQIEDVLLEDFPAEGRNFTSAFSICLLTDTFDRERQEHRVFKQLLDSYPSLLKWLKDRSEEEILHIGELVHHLLLGWGSHLQFVDWQESCRH
jgi:hypothetical protein